MERLTFSQLAKALGLKTASISVPAKRGNIEADLKNKTIDITLPKNKIWIDKQVAKGKTFDLNRVIQGGSVNKKDPPSPDDEPKSTPRETSLTPDQEELRAITLKKERIQLEKSEYESEIKKIEVLKKKGELIPADAVRTAFVFSIETFRTRYLQEATSLSEVLNTKIGGTHEELIELKKDLTESINSTYIDVKKQLIDSVDVIIKEYKEVRGRGQR